MKLEAADFEFLLAIIKGPTSLTSDKRLREELRRFSSASGAPDQKAKLCTLFEREIRYLGSAEVAYLARRIMRKHAGPGVPFQKIVSDVYRKLKLERPNALTTDEELLEHLVKSYTTVRVRKLSIEKQRALLESSGMTSADVYSFLKSNTSRFAIPALIQVAGTNVAQRLVTSTVIGTVAEVIGLPAAKILIGQLAARFPLWAEWLGPVAWVITGVWTLSEIQRPAMRKTVPLMLYLGLCMLRDGGLEK